MDGDLVLEDGAVVAQRATLLVEVYKVVVEGLDGNGAVADLSVFTVNNGIIVVIGELGAIGSSDIDIGLHSLTCVGIVRVGKLDLAVLKAYLMPAAHGADTVGSLGILIVVYMAGRHVVTDGVGSAVAIVNCLAGVDELTSYGAVGLGLAVKLNGLENALGVRIEHIVALEEPTGLDNAAEQIILVAVCVRSLAAVVLKCYAADRAGDCLFCRIVASGVTVPLAGRLDGYGVKQTSIDIVVIDGHLVLVGGDCKIGCSKVIGYELEYLAVIEFILRGDSVGLFTGGTADVVVDTVFFIDLVVKQRIGPCGGVVMAGEDDIYARCFADIGNCVVNFSIAAVAVGIVRRLVHEKHFPSGVALSSVLSQPIHSLLELGSGTCVVDDGEVNITVCQRVVAAGLCGGGEIEVVGSSIGVCVACILVVAENMDHIGAAEAIDTEQICDIVPVAVCRRIVDCIAGLDTEVKLGLAELAHNSFNVGRIVILNIAESKESCLVVVGADGLEGCDFAPSLAAAYLILIGRSGGETAEGNAVYIDSAVAALSEGAQCGLCRNGRPVLGTAYTVADILILSLNCVGHPSHALAVSSVVQGVEHETVGHSRVLTGCVVGLDIQLE